MVLAELNAFVSRPIAPTRRIALGDIDLGASTARGAAGVLLGAIIGRYSPQLDDETRADLVDLMVHVAADHHVPQPMMRHRFQTDRVGLQHITYRLTSKDDRPGLVFPTEEATPTQHVLVAVYAAATIDPARRMDVMSVMERALSYTGSVDDDLLRFLGGSRHTSGFALSDPIVWALETLALDLRSLTSGSGGRHGGRRANRATVAIADPEAGPQPELPAGLRRLPTKSEIQRAFRRQLRMSHPDHGAESKGAASRIADLTEARRILLDT